MGYPWKVNILMVLGPRKLVNSSRLL